MRMRILISILLAFSVTIPSTSYAGDGVTYDEQWTYIGIPAGAYSGYVKQVAPEMRYLPDSVLMNYAAGAFDSGLPVNVCSSITEKGCELTDRQIYYAVLPQCLLATDTDCISQISASIDGKALAVKPIGQFPSIGVQDFAGDPSLNLPTGSTSTLVEIPEAPHPGGDLYLVKAQMQGARWASSTSPSFNPPDFNVEIFAVGLKNGSYKEILVDTKTAKNWKAGLIPWTSDQNSSLCAARSTTQCAIPYPLPENVSFGLQFRLLNKPVSWLQGRFRDPSISISSDIFGNTILNVAAQPIRVPVLEVAVTKDKLVPAMYGQVFPSQDTSLGSTDQDSSQFALPMFLAWLSVSDNKAIVQPTSWSFRSTIANYGQYDARILKCFGDPSTPGGYLGSANEFRGLVTTNASQYIEGPPSFNEQDQTLDYKVAAPHFTPSGDVFKGTYNLVISSKFARCIYGFSNAPVQATISVTSETGEKDVATTVVGERDGLFYLAAYGFTFSSPVIKVKLTQDAPAASPGPHPSLSPTATPVPAPSKSVAPRPVLSVIRKVSITCIKGRIVKKILAAKPKCPSGYKLKGK